MSAIAGREFGSRTGKGAPMSSDQAGVDRRERLRQLALATLDLSKDPYFLRNHIGSYECRLCLTLHTNEGSYLAHTQGKRHQENVARRAYRDATRGGGGAMDGAGLTPAAVAAQQQQQQAMQRAVEEQQALYRQLPRVGRPGYTVTQSRDEASGRQSVAFVIDYPEIYEGMQPRHCFMSSYEQRIEPVDARFQYLIFAAPPYENVAFKIPNLKIERDRDAADCLQSHWDRDKLVFTLTLTFQQGDAELPPPPPPPSANGSGGQEAMETDGASANSSSTAASWSNPLPPGLQSGGW